MSKSDKTSRRAMIKSGVLGAAALATPAVISGSHSLTAQRAAPNPNLKLSGKTAFITGGARGIGLAIAQAMARAGANIVLFDIASGQTPGVGYALATSEDLGAAQRSIEALEASCLAIQGDVRQREAIEEAMQQTVATFGTLDILVVNAGVTQVGAIEDFSDQEIRTVYEINVEGAIKTTQAAAPIMQKQKSGRMLFMSSALGRMGNELFPVYASTKWALIGFAKSAALSYGKDNITCNVIAPGLVRTKLADNPYVLGAMMPDDPAPSFDRVSESLSSGNPLGVGHLEPEDVASAAMIFVDESMSKVTGEVFDVSLGSNARNVA